MTRCSFCQILRAGVDGYCSPGCREHAMREGCHDQREHSVRLLGTHIADAEYYAGVRHFGGHSSLEACGTIAGGRKSKDTRGKS